MLFLPDSQKIETLQKVNNQEIVSVIQLLIKLSESLNILQKHRSEELLFAQQVFVCQMIATFATTALLTLFVMLACGYQTEYDRD